MTWLDSIWPWVSDSSVWPLIFLVVLLGSSVFILVGHANYWLTNKLKTTPGSVLAFAVIASLLAVSSLADHTNPLKLPEQALFEDEMADLRESNQLTLEKLAAAEASLEDARLQLAASMAEEERLANLEEQLTAAQNELAFLTQRHANQQDAVKKTAELEIKLIQMEEQSQIVQEELEFVDVALQETQESLKNANAVLEAIGWDEVASEQMASEIAVREPPIPLPSPVWEAVQSMGGEPFVLFGVDEKAHLQAYYPEAVAEPKPFEELVEPQYRLHLAVEVGEGRGCWISPAGYRACLALREPDSP